MEQEQVFYTSTEEEHHSDGIYHNGLDIIASNGSYYIPADIIRDDCPQPHWKSPYEDYEFGHSLDIQFKNSEDAENFYEWLKTSAEYEETIPAYNDTHPNVKRINIAEAESVFLYIPGVGDACSAVIEQAVINENFMPLSLYLSIKGSGYADIEELLPSLFG